MRSTLAGALHPTPAVGGEPDDVAKRLIPALEGLDRGWYAGTLGWTDTNGDGEFCVTLRCALLRGELASCYAGCGIVADSDPAVRAGRDRGQAAGAAPGALRLAPISSGRRCERRQRRRLDVGVELPVGDAVGAHLDDR